MDILNESYEMLSNEKKALFRRNALIYLEQQKINRVNNVKSTIADYKHLKDILPLGLGATAITAVLMTFYNAIYYYGMEVAKDFEFATNNDIGYMSYDMFESYKCVLKEEQKHAKRRMLTNTK